MSRNTGLQDADGRVLADIGGRRCAVATGDHIEYEGKTAIVKIVGNAVYALVGGACAIVGVVVGARISGK